MSPEPWREYVEEMCRDIARVLTFIGELDREAFIRDEKTIFAVCYAFARLGEAVGHIPAEITAAHPEIEWRDIRHFRNFMIHVYLAVDPARVYDTARTDLPPLAHKLELLVRAARVPARRHEGGVDRATRRTRSASLCLLSRRP